MVVANSLLDKCLTVGHSSTAVPSRPFSQRLKTIVGGSPFVPEIIRDQDPPRFPPQVSFGDRPAIAPIRSRPTIVDLQKLSAQFHERTRQQKEARWLKENRTRFAGLWIALDGDQLLATGQTAKEVFALVGHLDHPPLVMQIESNTTPFAGW